MIIVIVYFIVGPQVNLINQFMLDKSSFVYSFLTHNYFCYDCREFLRLFSELFQKGFRNKNIFIFLINNILYEENPFHLFVCR